MDLLILFNISEKLIDLSTISPKNYTKEHIDFLNNPLFLNFDFGKKNNIKGGAAAALSAAKGLATAADPAKAAAGLAGAAGAAAGEAAGAAAGAAGAAGAAAGLAGAAGAAAADPAKAAAGLAGAAGAAAGDPAKAAAGLAGAAAGLAGAAAGAAGDDPSQDVSRVDASGLTSTQNENPLLKLFMFLVKSIFYPFIFIGLALVPWFYVSIVSFRKVGNLIDKNILQM